MRLHDSQRLSKVILTFETLLWRCYLSFSFSSYVFVNVINVHGLDTYVQAWI